MKIGNAYEKVGVLNVRRCKTNLRKLMNNKKFEVFKSDPSHYPGYTMIVQEPMYLQKILQNIEDLQKVKADL